MAVLLNGNSYQESDFIGSDGRGYANTNPDTNLPFFPDSIFTDLLAELAAFVPADVVAPGADGGVLVASSSAWVRATGVNIESDGMATAFGGAAVNYSQMLLIGSLISGGGATRTSAFEILADNISNDANGDGTIEPMFVLDAIPPTRITVQITAQSPVVDPNTRDFIRYTVSSDVVLRKEL